LRPSSQIALKIVVDQNIRGAESTFGHHGELSFLEGRAIRNEHLRDAEVLIIRTATAVDETLLRGTPVRFVGSTSIGIDHIDTDWLDRQEIAWANAPGCNADGTAQYTLAIAWLACERHGRSLPDLSAGVIGRGNVGSRVQALFRTLGMRVVANDPPLADAGEPELVSLDEALAQDVVCLHVPLTREGPYPTFRFIGRRALARIRPNSLLINASRGDVVDGGPLLDELRAGRLHAALDVWPGEPRVDPDLLLATTVATPHVAGYSDDGKYNGTRMVYEAFCASDGLEPRPMAMPARSPELHIREGQDPLARALEASCFVQRHDDAMRALAACGAEERTTEFDRLRRDYPSRRDFQAWRVHCGDPGPARTLARMGFQVLPS
jgi:erythronate-4-phosphate dehydrogenase